MTTEEATRSWGASEMPERGRPGVGSQRAALLPGVCGGVTVRLGQQAPLEVITVQKAFGI